MALIVQLVSTFSFARSRKRLRREGGVIGPVFPWQVAFVPLEGLFR